MQVDQQTNSIITEFSKITQLTVEAFEAQWFGRAIAPMPLQTQLKDLIERIKRLGPTGIPAQSPNRSSVLGALHQIKGMLRHPPFFIDQNAQAMLAHLQEARQMVKNNPNKTQFVPLVLTDEAKNEIRNSLTQLLGREPSSDLNPMLSPVACFLQDNYGVPVSNECETLANKCREAIGILKRKHSDTSDENERKEIRKVSALIILLASFFAYNAAVEYHTKEGHPLNQDEDNPLQKQIGLYESYLDEAENDCFDEVFTNPLLKDLQKELYAKSIVIMNTRSYRPFYCFPKHINFHIERKKQVSKLKGGCYNGELIYNPTSTLRFNLDPVCISQLIQKLREIQQGQKPRTQFVIYPTGNSGHVLCLDAQCNPASSQLKMVCIESARHILQVELLTRLAHELTQQSIPYEILACQSRLQKGGAGCNVFAFLLSVELSKTSYEILSACQKIPASTNWEFYNSKTDKLESGKTLYIPGVTWIPITTFSPHVLKLGQSLVELRQRLLEKIWTEEGNEKANEEKNLKVDMLLRLWIKMYEMNYHNYDYYFSYRLRSLQLKYESKDPYQDLTEEKVLAKVKVSPTEEIARTEALFRHAAGNSPMREMRFLIQRLKPEEINGILSPWPYTPLYQALLCGHANRTLLLLQHGARPDLPYVTGTTPLSIFPRSLLKNNPIVAAEMQRDKELKETKDLKDTRTKGLVVYPLSLRR